MSNTDADIDVEADRNVDLIVRAIVRNFGSIVGAPDPSSLRSIVESEMGTAAADRWVTDGSKTTER